MDVLENQSNFFCGRKFVAPMGLNGMGFWGHLNLHPHDKCSTTWSLNYHDQMLSTSCFSMLTVVKKDIQGIYLWCWYSKWYLCTGNNILFLTDDEWMFLRNSHFLWQRISHPRGFQPRTLGFMPNTLVIWSGFWPILVPDRIKSAQNTMS